MHKNLTNRTWFAINVCFTCGSDSKRRHYGAVVFKVGVFWCPWCSIPASCSGAWKLVTNNVAVGRWVHNKNIWNTEFHRFQEMILIGCWGLSCLFRLRDLREVHECSGAGDWWSLGYDYGLDEYSKCTSAAKSGRNVQNVWRMSLDTLAESWTLEIIPASDPKQCVGGHQQRILYVGLPIRAAATNRMKIVYKTYVCVFCTLHISRSSAGAMSPIHVLASTNMDPLQDPHLRIHVSASLCLRLLCKIHVSRLMSQHPFVSQDPLQDPCLRIHISAAICISGACLSIFESHGFSARPMSPDSCLSIVISQDPLQGPCLRIHVSASLYLRILCKIHVSGSMCPIHVLASTNMDPLQDPCLRFMSQHPYVVRILCKIHVSGSMSQHPFLRILCKIHISGFMSQHLCISGSSARSMSPDPDIGIHMYLRILCKIHVSNSCLSIHV